jgi:hypothetical protein
VPGTAIGVDIRIACHRQRFMDSLPVAQRCSPIRRRAHKRMAELHACADMKQLVSLRRGESARSEPERLGRTPDNRRVAHRVGRRQEHQ